MKAFIVSDIHGSLKAAEAIDKIIQAEKPDMILMLGDFLYNGPRNGVFDDYDPMGVVEILNKYSDKIIAVCGNCDSRIDQELLGFKMPDVNEVMFHGRRYVMVHGDLLDKSMVTLNQGDILLNGHTHLPNIEVVDGVLLLNPGSITFPKQKDHEKTYMIIIDNELRLYGGEGKLIALKNIDELI